MSIFLCVICFFFIVFSVTEALNGSTNPLYKAFITMTEGILALTVTNLVAPYTNIEIPVSFLSLGISIICGIPGVLTMIFLNFF